MDNNNEDVKLVEPVNEYMKPPAPKFKVVSVVTNMNAMIGLIVLGI
jgi:hypothetical protein